MPKVKWNEQAGKYDLLENGSKEEGSFYLDGYLKSNLDYVRGDIRDDNDAVILVTGKEGSGKSVFAMTVGKYLDNTLNLNRIVFDPGEFRKAVLAAKKYECVVYDEAITGMRAGRWYTEINQALTELLAQIRQKNLAVVIVMPSFFELGKYIAIHRSVALLHVYRKDGKRGHFKAYDEDKKTRMYLLGKKTYDYSVVTPNFWGFFPNQYAVDERAYRRKKLQALTAVQQQMTRQAERYKAQRNALIKLLYEELEWTQEDIAGRIASLSAHPMSQEQIGRVLRQTGGVLTAPS